MKEEQSKTPLVGIIMGSTSDMRVVRAAATYLDDMSVPFELNALSAHRTPEMVADYARGAKARGLEVIIAAAGGAAHLPGVVAAFTTLPVIGVPVQGAENAMGGLDSVLSILQMPSGIPVATVALNGAKNAAILATQILALKYDWIAQRVEAEKETLRSKIEQANRELQEEHFAHRVQITPSVSPHAGESAGGKTR